MTLCFLVDAQLPPRFAERLRGAGYLAEHVNDIGLGAATDNMIAAHALASGAVIVSKDAGFATLGRHDERVRVVWVRIGNTTITALWRAFQPRLAEIETALRDGDMLIEVR